MAGSNVDGPDAHHLYVSLMPIRRLDCWFLHGSENPTCTAVVDKYFAGYCSLQVMTRGELALSYNSRVHRMAGAWCWACWPGPRIRFHRAPGCASWHHRYVAVRGPLVDQWRAEGLLPIEPQPVPEDPAFIPTMDACVAAFRDGRPLQRLQAANRLESLLLRLAEDRREQVAESWVERAKRMLAEPASGFDAGIATVATACGKPLSTFRRRFQAMVGVSPRDYALTARLERAQELLLTTDLPVGAIADRLGYADIFYFSRQFRSRIGISPTVFRESRYG